MDYNCRHIIYKMKKVYSTAVLSLLHLTLFAQSGSSLSYMYRPGDIIHRYGIEDFCISTKVENQIWDYSSLRTDSKDFIVEYTSDKDNDDIVVEISNGTRYYYVQDSTAIRNVGYENNNIAVEFDRPETVLVFPLSFGNKRAGAFHGSCMYCEEVMARDFGTYSVEVDGKGKLLLPDGKVLDKVYRVHYTKDNCRTAYDDIHTSKELVEYINKTHYLSNDSIATLTANQDNCYRHTEVYKWYAEGFRYPIIEAIVYGKNDNGGNNTIAYYYPPDEQEKLYDTENERTRSLCTNGDNVTDSKNDETDSYDNKSNDGSLPYTIESGKNSFVIHTSVRNAEIYVDALLSDISGVVLRRASGNSDSPIIIDCAGLISGEYAIRITIGEKIYERKVHYNNK